ncbi:unnamed protein product [Spodoptera exigua]|nr:unnamed protein product [Spodoptera exigua]
MTSRKYCAVFGCMNSTITNRDLSFFKLPKTSERRLQWLQLIRRDDLKNKQKFSSYHVCEKHFNSEDFLHSSNRKVLKRNTLPMLLLPNLASTDSEVSASLREDKQTQTASLSAMENCTQTENTTKVVSSQTSKSLFSNTPRERKLKAELIQCKKKLKLHETKTKKAEENTFHRLCDKFLTDKLALLIKAQSQLKQHGKGNRYDNDYINYCSNLYSISPKAYEFLQSTLCLPCPSTLYKHSVPIKSEINESTMSHIKSEVEQMAEAENENVNT